MKQPLLIVDDEALVRNALRLHLEEQGYHTEQAGSGEDALRLMNTNFYPIILMDLRMPGLSGLDVLQRMQAMHKKSEVILMTGFGTIEDAVKAIQFGAFDFLTKPIDFDRLQITVRNACEKVDLHQQVDTLSTQIEKELKLENIIGSNLEMLKIFDTIRKVSDNDVSVLITGESGTGKELIARALHSNSKRARGQFLPVNCVSLSENLLESELFGHERGAFTGATGRKIGYFEAAQNGTIFLDEIGDLPMGLQAKLLRTLQERTIQRVGSTELIGVNARVICATNKDLDECIQAGTFREDLYYRINVLSLELPPLRRRKDDLPRLAGHFVRKFSERMGKEPAQLSPEAEEALLAYSWPGNIRELENIIQRAVALSENAHISTEHLPHGMLDAAKNRTRASSFLTVSSFKDAKNAVIDDFEREFLAESLKRNEGNVTRAADEIGLGRTVMQRMLKKHGIESRDIKKLFSN